MSNEHPIAYFCAEYGITDLLPIYSGGLGVLAGDIYQEAATEHFPFVAVGLYYQWGFFHQAIDNKGQEEYRQKVDAKTAGLELMQGKNGDTLLIEVPMEERTVYLQVWRYRIGSTPLYLLDTDHWKNSDQDKRITDELYGGDQEKRIQQEIVLGIGGYRALAALGITPSLYHMNEGHSAFLSLELIAENLLQLTPDISAAIEAAKLQLVFTNHTLVPAGNDLFPHALVRRYLAHYAETSKLDMGLILNLGTNPENPDEFLMTALGMRMAAVSNAVSKAHARKASELWPGSALKAITNGVYLPGWIAPDMHHILNEQTPGWRTDTINPKAWQPLRKVSNERLWKVHQTLKEQMLHEVYARSGIRLDPHVLTIVWARRFAQYKRPHLLFSDVMRLKEEFLFSPERPIQVIIAGKAHPEDVAAKELIEEITGLAEHELKHRVVFLDDYSMYLAKFLVAGADIWLNTPEYGMEASGTSGMKSAANGVLQYTIADGWAAEVDWRGIGFVLPNDQPERRIYEQLAKTILPLYYQRDAAGIPQQWTIMMKEGIIRIAPAFSTSRLLNDYRRILYEPLL